MRNRILIVALLAAFTGCSGSSSTADLVLTGGVVWTGVDGEQGVTAIAVKDGQVVFTGSDADAQAYIGGQTEHIELDGRMVTPGFMDNHTHFMSGGFQLASVNLRDAATPEEFARRIGEFASTLPEGRWITGGDWDHELWGGDLPRREWIDSLTPNNPVLVSRLDGHMALANSAALRMAEVTAATADPDGGTIIRNAQTGEPTGMLRDNAMDLVSRVIPDATEAELDEAFARAQEHALSLGVTLINDMGAWSHLETYRRARQQGNLTMRIYSFVPLGSWERLRDYVAENGRGDAQLMWGGLKGFVDGSLGSTTAWFYEPYNDAPETAGLLTTDTTALRSWVRSADSAGLHLAVHAIGDRANDWLLDVFAEAEAANGERDRRFRIEHAQHLTPAAIERMATMGVVPSMQPYHAIDDGRWAEKRIGAERIKSTYAFRSLLDAGAHLTFGSDWTVAPLNPLLGVYAAVTRRTIDDANPSGWVPEQKISVEEALRAYTSSNAFASYLEDSLGTLQAGRLADLVVLSDNLLAIEPERIPEVNVDMTVIDGEVVYRRR